MGDFNFSSPELDLNYTSETGYIEDAMDGTVYHLTGLILNSTFTNNLLPEDLLEKLNFEDMGNFTDALVNDWQEVVTYNWRFCFAIVFGLIVAFIIPLAGIIWCCSKCCCRKAGRENERKNSDSLCLGFGVFLLMVLPILFGLFGSIWFYASNSVLQHGVDDLPDKLDDAFYDINLYINNTVKQVNHLAVLNFGEVRTQFKVELNNTGAELSQTFDSILDEIEFDHLVNVSRFITDTALKFNVEILDEIKGKTGTLKGNVSSLTSKVEGIISTGQTLTGDTTGFCSVLDLIIGQGQVLPTCNDLNKAMDEVKLDDSKVDYPVDFSGFEIPKDSLTAIKDFGKNVDDAQSKLDGFSDTFVGDYTDKIDVELVNIGEKIKEEVDKITLQLNDLGLNSSLLPDDFDEYVDLFTDVISQALLAPVTLLCVILALVFVGAVLGCCGGVGGSVKGCGSRFFSASLAIFFIFGFFLWLFTVVLFFAGALTEKMVCETIRTPNDSEIGPKIDDYLKDTLRDLANSTTNLTLSGLLEACEGEGQGIYDLFELKNRYDVDILKDWRETYNIDPVIDEVQNLVQATINETVEVTVITLEMQTNIDNTINKLSSVQTDFFEKSNISVTEIVPFEKIDETILQFNKILDLVNTNPALSGYNQSLSEIITKLKDLKTAAEIDSIQEDLDFLATFDKKLSYEDKFLPQLIEDALKSLTFAGNYFNTVGRSNVTAVSDKTVETVIGLVDRFVGHINASMHQDVGLCGPISDIYTGLLSVGLCHDIVSPFNGLWSGIGLILFFFIPGLFLICCLDNIFRREKQRPKYANPEFHGNPKGTAVYTETRFTYEVPDHYKGKNGNRK